MFLPPPPGPDERKPAAPGNGANPHPRVMQALENGALPENICSHLMSQGYDRQQAEDIVDHARRAIKAHYASDGIDIDDPDGLRRAGHRNMTFGAALALLGLAITLGTCMIASQAGGSYVITTGLIASGVMLFFRGSNQAANANQKSRQAAYADHTEADEPPAVPVNPSSEGIQRRSRLGRRSPRL